MGRLIDFYATQARILWEWRGGPWALFKRLVITLLVSTVSFVLTAWLLPGIDIGRVRDAVVAVVLMALFNAVIRPVLLTFVASFDRWCCWRSSSSSCRSLTFLVIAPLSQGVQVDGFFSALIGSFVFAAFNTLLTAILGVDRDGSYFGLLVSSLMAKRSAPKSDKPGLVIIQIDGLAHPILAARVRAGSVNTIAGWIRDGSHRLSQWEAMLPSMTSGSQAGILHGTNDGIPAFRWYERDRQHLMVSSNPKDAAEIVRRLSNGEGLLSNNGRRHLQPDDRRRDARLHDGQRDHRPESQGLGESQAFLGFFFSPSGYMRSFSMFFGEFIKERFQARRTARSGVQPQMHRDLKYAAMRAASNVLLRDVNVSLIIEEMHRGANVIYADFTDYDELAHHCGPERVESLQALDGVDAAIATVAKAAEDAPRPYRFVVLSDHGQSLGATFKQRYGQSLGEVVRDLMSGRATVVQTKTQGEGSTFVNSFLSEITRSKGVGPAVARAALANQTTDGVVNLDEEEIPPPADESTIAVVGSGNLGLVWFTGYDHRLTVEELEDLHPKLVSTLAAHPGVGLMMVRSATRGAVIFGRNGVRYLDEDRVEGEDPTTLFGPHTIMSLKHEDGMVHAPDLLFISQYDPDMGEVAAFEEQIGSHGGLGGFQTQPFILHPVEWELDEPVPLGAPAIYRNLRRWLSSIGIELGKPATETPAPTPAPAPEPAAAAS